MRRKPNPANNFTLSPAPGGQSRQLFDMNNFNICGRVVNVGQKRADRAPWPVEIETEIGRDKTVIVPVEIFRPEPPPRRSNPPPPMPPVNQPPEEDEIPF